MFYVYVIVIRHIFEKFLHYFRNITKQLQLRLKQLKVCSFLDFHEINFGYLVVTLKLIDLEI